MLYKVYLTSVFKRQYKYDLAMKWNKDQSSNKQEHQVPWVSSALHIVCQRVCLGKFCFYWTDVRTVTYCASISSSESPYHLFTKIVGFF